MILLPAARLTRRRFRDGGGGFKPTDALHEQIGGEIVDKIASHGRTFPSRVIMLRPVDAALMRMRPSSLATYTRRHVGISAHRSSSYGMLALPNADVELLTGFFDRLATPPIRTEPGCTQLPAGAAVPQRHRDGEVPLPGASGHALSSPAP